MTQSPTPATQSIPAPIQWAITVYGERLQRARALDDQMTTLELRITETEKMLRQMREHYAAMGREHTTVHGDAELLLVMIQQACARIGIDVPVRPGHRPTRRRRLSVAARRDAPGATPRAIGQSPVHLDGRPAADDAETDTTAEADSDLREEAESGPAPDSSPGATDAAEDTDGDLETDIGLESDIGLEAAADDDAAPDVAADSTLAEKVRDRHNAGVSQRAIARELDLDRRMVRQILDETTAEVPAG
jgi:hypothetical protein